jgi:hypothetical protein
MWPGMPPEQRRAVAKQAAAIDPILRSQATLFYALEAAAPADESDLLADLDARCGVESGGNLGAADSAVLMPDPHAGAVAVEGGTVTIFRQKEVATWLKGLPVLIASATAKPDRLRRFFPTLQHTPAPAVAMPYVTIRQMHGGWGKRAMRRRIKALIARARFEMLGMGADGLVIVQKEFAEAFRKALPGVHVLHYGALIGADVFRDVRKVLIIGGPFPTNEQIAERASCETGRIVPVEAPVPTPYRGLLSTGEGFEGSRMAYRDPAAQRVLEAAYDSAVIQAIGRPRGINRGPENPVEIVVCVNVPLPYPVDAIGRMRPLTTIEKLFETGIVPSGGAGMHRFWPEIVPSAEAGRSAKHRIGGDGALHAAMRRHAGRMPWATDQVIYQPPGRGFGPRHMYVARPQLAEAKAIAEREFGELVRWEVRPFSDGCRPLDPTAEDRFASLLKTQRGDRNALLDLAPDHPVPPPPIAPSTAARAPPD